MPNEQRFVRAASRAVAKTAEVVGLMVMGIVRLVQGKISFKTVGGPIMIFDIAGRHDLPQVSGDFRNPSGRQLQKLIE